MRIDWSAVAVEDLLDIRDYLARDSPLYAQQFVEQVMVAVEGLVDLPLMGRQVPEADDIEVRELIFQGYRMMYLVERSAERVAIVTVVHGSRDLEHQSDVS
ncbi:type II toxin-antitoxin system RelE/ParE family toxin [Synechococcus sp. PCC 7336]|uniref:type II toxin-antitoxin system RelE/ParE family toxin n=1 Tax=Synechococcus sp. PCC 7336 TaxID=195250 RepID=UPI00034BBB92|nr:type II toxin-antitoxin system RelE/ParE family toxin [Synechococcus sp. PCC 7336]